MVFSFIALRLRIIIFIYLLLLTFNDCIENEKREKSNILSPSVTANFYDLLKNAMGEVLYRSNHSIFNPIEQEVDYDYTNKDSPDIEEPPAKIFEHNRQNASSKHFVHHEENRYEDHFDREGLKELDDDDYYDPDMGSYKYHNLKSDSNENFNSNDKENENKHEKKFHSSQHDKNIHDDKLRPEIHSSKSEEKEYDLQHEKEFHSSKSEGREHNENHGGEFHSSKLEKNHDGKHEELHSLKFIEKSDDDDHERKFHISKAEEQDRNDKQRTELHNSKSEEKDHDDRQQSDMHSEKSEEKNHDEDHEREFHISKSDENDRNDKNEKEFHNSKSDEKDHEDKHELEFHASKSEENHGDNHEKQFHNSNSSENDDDDKNEKEFHNSKSNEKDNEGKNEAELHTPQSDEKNRDDKNEVKLHSDDNEKGGIEENDLYTSKCNPKDKSECTRLHGSKYNEKQRANKEERAFQNSKLDQVEKSKKHERGFHSSYFTQGKNSKAHEKAAHGSTVNQKIKGYTGERHFHDSHNQKGKTNIAGLNAHTFKSNVGQVDFRTPKFNQKQISYNTLSTNSKSNENIQISPPGSLYDKFKAKLDPLVQQLNLSMQQDIPNQNHKIKTVLSNIRYKPNRNTKKRKNDHSSQVKSKKKFYSLYEEFKKRLQAFSSELDVDAGFLNKKKHLQKNGKAGIHGKIGHIDDEGMTAEFKKVKKVVERIDKLNSAQLTTHRTSFGNQLKHPTPKESVSYDSEFDLKPAKVVDEDYLKYHNYHRIYSGPQPATSGGFINNDYDYNDMKNEKFTNHKYGKKISRYTSYPRGYRAKKHLRRLTSALIGAGTDGANFNPFYPGVLTSPIRSPYGPPADLTPRSLLENIAQQLNVTTLDVAKKVAGIQDLNLSTLNKDPKLHSALQKYIENSVVSATNPAKSVGIPRADSHVATESVSSPSKLQPAATVAPIIDNVTPVPAAPVAPTSAPSGQYNPNLEQALKIQPIIQRIIAASKTYTAPEQATTSLPVESSIAKPCKTNSEKKQDCLSPDQISEILEKLVNKLEEIHCEKNECSSETNHNDACSIENNACKLSGAWLSHAMGLRFNINPECNIDQNCMPPEARSIPLNVSIVECTPPKTHSIIDTDWPITGNTLKQIGGPFFLYTQKRSENVLATFVGYCRTCNGVDSIYGTWSISNPSKDCQDITTSFQTKTDIMRRYTLEEKRKQRFKELLYKNSKYSKKP